MSEEELKYPIGRFVKPRTFTRKLLKQYIIDIETFPVKLRKETDNLTGKQLDTKYRPGGWTIRQVINHCADSHMNGFIRFKLALTENKPTIKPYFEAKWAELPDSKTMETKPALGMIDGIHKRSGFSDCRHYL